MYMKTYMYTYVSYTCYCLFYEVIGLPPSFPSSLLLEGYYYSGGSIPGPLNETFVQQDYHFVSDDVAREVLAEPSTQAALSSELGYDLEYSVDGATQQAPGTSQYIAFITRC